MSDRSTLTERLPHGDAFLFLSEVIEHSPARSAQGVWRLTGDEPFFAGHFPSCPIVPGVLIVEALAQLSGVAASGADDSSPLGARTMLAHVNVRFHASVQPPAEIQLRSALARAINALVLFDVEATCEGRRIASGTLALARRGAENDLP